MKKYLILFISIFSTFFLIDNVNATVGGTTLISGTDYTIDQVPIDELGATWQTVGTTLCYNCSYYPSYNFLINRNDYSQIAIGLSSNAPYVNVITFNNFTINNFALFSNSSVTQPKLILSEGNLPTFGGTCNTGSFCYSFINSGYQGSGYSATVHSNTIYIDSFGVSPDGSINMGSVYKKYFACSNNGNCYVGTGSPASQWGFSNQTNLNSVYFTTQTITNGSYQPVNQYIIEREPPFSLEPEYDYEIMEGSERGKRVLFEFENFSENSYINVVDMSSGNIYTEEDLYMSTTYDIDNISYDSIFYYEIYNDDELIGSGTINVYSDFLATGQPIIRIDLLTNEKTSVLSYEELKDDYNLYYAINDDNFINLTDNPENLEIANLGNSKKIFFPNTGIRQNNNYVLRGRITDSNGRILYDIGYNVVFFPDKPYFSFESSYNPNSGANEVKITLHNFENSDVVYYSYDNINFIQFDDININTLVVYADTDIYTKVVRGNNTYYGFYHVNLNGYNNSSNSIYDNSNGYDDNLLTGFKNLFNGVDLSFLSNISTFFNALKGSYVFRFVMLCITGALILFIMRMIRR